MIKKIFDKIYKKELEEIKPNKSLGESLKKELGFDPRWSDVFRLRYMIPSVVAVFMVFMYSVYLKPFSGAVIYKGIALLEPGVDDWQFSPYEASDSSAGIGRSAQPLSIAGTGLGYGSFTGLSGGSAPSLAAPPVVSNKLGLTVGGSQDVVTFRSNIENNFLPKRSSLTHEGLFSEYFFDTGVPDDCDELFCPQYSQAISADPISGKEDRYLAVGLSSGMEESDFQRKPLDLVIVLDISGSMSSGFSSYYYDQKGKIPKQELEDENKTKLDIASEAIVDLMSHLVPEDRFGVVLFDDSSYVAKPMNLVSETDMASIKSHILELNPQGGTNMSAGMSEALDLYKKVESGNDRQKRIIFLTDAMPNTGEISKDGLLGMAKDASGDNIFTSFIGIGVDFQTNLIEEITKVKGANYHSVHTSKDFKDRMDKNFDFMVTPLVFDLGLKLEANGYEIEKVYGSPEANESTGELLKVRTLFPSETTEEGVRGGIIILKLKKLSDNASLKLLAEYIDVDGKNHSNSQTIEFREGQQSFDNSGIRKGVLLSRYADLLGNWIIDELRTQDDKVFEIEPLVDIERGIMPVPPDHIIIDWGLSEWEQGSVPLSVQFSYKESFRKFREHFTSEMKVLNDSDLEQEIEILNKLVNL